MADVSKVKTNGGNNVYNIKDSAALKGVILNGIPIKQTNGLVDLKEFSTLTYNGAPNNPQKDGGSYDYTNKSYEKKIVFLHDYLLSTNKGITDFLKNTKTKIEAIGENNKPTVVENGKTILLQKTNE